MEIDWFTIGAQIVNFLVLVWLLKRFLYQPVLDAIDHREQRIAKALADAAAAKAEAALERDGLQARNDAFEAQRAGLMAEAVAAADLERQRLQDLARDEADGLRQQHKAALARDAARLNAELARRAESEVFAVARKALGDLADERLEAALTRLFVRKLASLSVPDKTAMRAALASHDGVVTVQSAFALLPQQRKAITQAIEKAFETPLKPAFEVAPELVGGIELVGVGLKLSWSLSAYLADLEKSVADLLTGESSKIGGQA